MSERTQELKRLYQRYGTDSAALLAEYPSMENLRVFSDRREGLLEWYAFRKGASLLMAGSGCGALTGMLLRKGLKVTVLDPDAENLELERLRWDAPELDTVLGTITKTGIPLLKIPIREDVAEMIEGLKKEAATKSTEWNNPERYLFNTYKGVNTGLPLSKPAFAKAVQDMINRKGSFDYDKYGITLQV